MPSSTHYVISCNRFGAALFKRLSTRGADSTIAFVRHENAAAFLAAAAPLLQRNRAGNSGFMAWAKTFARNPPEKGEAVLLATLQQQKMPVGIALRRDNGPL